LSRALLKDFQGPCPLRTDHLRPYAHFDHAADRYLLQWGRKSRCCRNGAC